MTTINPIKLTQQLIAIPSYVQGNINENEIGDFIYNYLEQFSFLNMQKQLVETNRNNIIVPAKGKPQLFLAAHMDTVEPKQGWTKKQGQIEENRLYGLGANDTKGGLAALLSSLHYFKQIEGLGLLFYCDEEYDFKGIRTFINQQKSPVGQLAVFSEPMQLQIRRAHRGIIEMAFAINGSTGHAGNPSGGNNAIRGMITILEHIETEVKRHSDPYLGSSSLNIAHFHGGLNLGKRKGQIVLGQQGNNIPDYAEAIIDIRPTKTLNTNVIQTIINQAVTALDFQLHYLRIRHDIQGINTPVEELSRLEQVVTKVLGKTEYLDPINKGAGDAGFIANAFQIPVAYIGPKGRNTHKPDEWVDTPSLHTLQQLYVELIKEYCKTFSL